MTSPLKAISKMVELCPSINCFTEPLFISQRAMHANYFSKDLQADTNIYFS